MGHYRVAAVGDSPDGGEVSSATPTSNLNYSNGNGLHLSDGMGVAKGVARVGVAEQPGHKRNFSDSQVLELSSIQVQWNLQIVDTSPKMSFIWR